MKKKTLIWLYIGAIFMIVVSAVASILCANILEDGPKFILPIIFSIFSLTFLEEIRCIRFGGILKPRLGWLIRKFEKDNPDEYLKVIESSVFILMIAGAAFFAKDSADLIFKLISNLLS